jgi:hypothetical protein
MKRVLRTGVAGWEEPCHPGPCTGGNLTHPLPLCNPPVSLSPTALLWSFVSANKSPLLQAVSRWGAVGGIQCEIRTESCIRPRWAPACRKTGASGRIRPWGVPEWEDCSAAFGSDAAAGGSCCLGSDAAAGGSCRDARRSTSKLADRLRSRHPPARPCGRRRGATRPMGVAGPAKLRSRPWRTPIGRVARGRTAHAARRVPRDRSDRTRPPWRRSQGNRTRPGAGAQSSAPSTKAQPPARCAASCSAARPSAPRRRVRSPAGISCASTWAWPAQRLIASPSPRARAAARTGAVTWWTSG